MKLSTALDQRLKELRAWRQEVVLAIRKAFTFDDAVLQDGIDSIPFGQGLVFARQQEGYGIRGAHYKIAMRPDVASRTVVVTRYISKPPSGEISEVHVDASLDSQGGFKVDLVKELQEEIVDFLASAELEPIPIDW